MRGNAARKSYLAAAVLAAGGVWLGPAAARAESAACGEAYEKAQEDKAGGRLNAALAHLRACVAPACPQFIRDDCSRWLDQVEAALPSVVFAVRRDREDQTEVEVACDGSVLTRSLDGKAIALDPGLRTFSFRLPGFAPVERQLLIREGERNRIVDVDFRSPRAHAPAVGIAQARPVPPRDHTPGRSYLTYGLAGVGALGLAGFTLFALLGNDEKGELERSCAPDCQAGQVDGVKTKYLLADVSLGVGLLSLGAATYLYLSHRGDRFARGTPATVIGFAPHPSGAGGVLQLSTRF